MTFKAGSSGNPKGRPQGSGHRQQLFNALVEPYREALFDTGISLALAGNEGMLRLFLERMLPSRPTDDTIEIDAPKDLKKADSLLEYGENTLKAASAGHITPQQAKTVMATIEMQRKNVETNEIVDRVAVIERVLKDRS